MVKSIKSKEMNSRCQIDLNDVQAEPDDKFKFILVYQDHLIKGVAYDIYITNTLKNLRMHYWIFLRFLAFQQYDKLIMAENLQIK